MFDLFWELNFIRTLSLSLGFSGALVLWVFVLVGAFALVLALCVAMGDEDEHDPALEELCEAFRATRHGTKLPNKLVTAMGQFFLETVKVESLEEVPMDEPDELEESARDSWLEGFHAPLPGVLALKVRKWAGEKITSNQATKDTPLAWTLAGLG